MSTEVKKPRVKNLTKSKTAENRIIETSLINKDEVFRMLALAEATGLPLLLIGAPGVAKTKTVLEYAKAWMFKNVDKTDTEAMRAANAQYMEKVYILETDEGTKSSEVKGMPDMQSLFVDNKYELVTPIASADVVVINEVDKASSNIRNSLLGVMNERFLFNGRFKIPCKWKIFVATCNTIPKDEVNNPFWDRFVLKLQVNRVTAGEIIKYFSGGDRTYKQSFNLGIPNKEEIMSVEVPKAKMEKFVSVGYSKCSDRTLTFMPNLTKAVSFIWDISIDKALIKVANLMIDNAAAEQLQNLLYSPAMKTLMAQVDMLWTIKTTEDLNTKLDAIGNLVNNFASQGTLGKEEADEINNTVNYVLDNLKLEDEEAMEEVGEEELELA